MKTLLELIRQVAPGEHRCSWYWLCKCECGNLTYQQPSDVRKGKVKSCGCIKRAKTARTHFRDWTGHEQHYLRVVRDVGSNEAGLVIWEAVCTYKGCGILFRTSSDLLRKGQESCGCKRLDEARAKQTVIKRLIEQRKTPTTTTMPTLGKKLKNMNNIKKRHRDAKN